MTLEIYNEAGQLVICVHHLPLLGLGVQASPDLDANANAVAIQQIKLENEGWQRDDSVKEPTEPTYTIPSS